MKKYLHFQLSFVILFLLVGFLGAFFAAAQTTSSADLQKFIRELQSQIQALQAEVRALQQEFGKSTGAAIPSPAGEAGPVSASLLVPEREPAVPLGTPAISLPQSEVAPFEVTRSLARGSSGDDVRRLQEFLAKDKEIYPDGLITGYFGPLTETAVKKWQKKHSIESIGIVGPKTIAKLKEIGRGVIEGLLEQGAGSSGFIPPGLLHAPGIEKKFDAPTALSVPGAIFDIVVATSTATGTPLGAISAIPATPATPAQPATPGTAATPATPAVSATPATSAATTVATATTTSDMRAPIVSNVMATSHTATSFVMTWTTDEVSDSQVEYGPTFAYGSTTALDTSRVTSHSVLVSGLQSSASYHVMVKSRDAAGNLGTGTFAALTSAAAATSPVTSIITSSYVNPTPNRSIPSLTFVGQITGLYHPAGVNVSPSGSIYVADYHNDNVKVYNASLQWIKTIGSTRGSASGQFSEPWDIGFDGSGRAFISDTNNNRVQIFDANGNYVSQISLQKESHQGVAFNSDGYLYVSGRVVEVFTTAGSKVTDLSLSSSDNTYPRNIAIDNNNRVYFSNPDYGGGGNHAITIQTPTGSLIKKIPLGYEPSFIDIDDLFRIWVGDPASNKIKVYDSDGALITDFQIPVASSNYTLGVEVSGSKFYISIMNDNLVRVYSITDTSSSATTPTPTPTPIPTPSPTPTATPTPTASTTPISSPTPTPIPIPIVSDTTGPAITSLSITPTSGPVGTVVTFMATAQDPSGLSNIVYDIKYPDSTYVLRPNCNFTGETSGTCSLLNEQPIDHAMSPAKLGDYVITIRITDKLSNTATYYANGTVTNGSQSTHNLTIPSITISAAATPLSVDVKINGKGTISNTPYDSVLSVTWTSGGAASCVGDGSIIPGANGNPQWPYPVGSDSSNSGKSLSGSTQLYARHANFGYANAPTITLGVRCYGSQGPSGPSAYYSFIIPLNAPVSSTVGRSLASLSSTLDTIRQLLKSLQALQP